jgi:hypothetical protein
MALFGRGVSLNLHESVDYVMIQLMTSELALKEYEYHMQHNILNYYATSNNEGRTLMIGYREEWTQLKWLFYLRYGVVSLLNCCIFLTAINHNVLHSYLISTQRAPNVFDYAPLHGTRLTTLPSHCIRCFVSLHA